MLLATPVLLETRLGSIDINANVFNSTRILIYRQNNGDRGGGGDFEISSGVRKFPARSFSQICRSENEKTHPAALHTIVCQALMV